MNKEILLQSLKSVAVFIAILAGTLCVTALILSNIPDWLGATLIIVSTIVGLTYLEYKHRLDKESWKRFKDGIK